MKKHLTKAVAASISGAIALSMLAGCSTGAANTASTSTGAASTAETSTSATAAGGSKTKVVVWTNNRHDLEYMNKVVDEFNTSNSDIEIEYVAQTENYENLISMAASSGQAPDVMSQVGSEYFNEFVQNGLIQPLNSYFTDEYRKVNEVDDHIYQGQNADGEDIYWVPGGKRSGARIIYNKDLLDSLSLEVPATLSGMVDLAKQVTEAGNGDSYGVIFPGASSPFERWIEHSAEMSGVTPYDYANGRYDFSGFKPVCEAIRQMFTEGSVFPGSASMKIDPVRVQFSEGTVAIHGNASQEATVLTEQFPAKMNWGVAQVPTLDGTIKGAENCSPNFGWMMSSSTKNAEAAWKVIEYLQSESVLKGYLEGGYTLPMSSYMDGVIDKTKIGRMADFTGVDYEAVYPVAPNVTPEGQTYRDALWNACLADGPDIDQTIASLNDSYNKALDNDVAMGKVKRLIITDYDPMHPDKGTVEYQDK